jgi:hypothetical protein
MDAESVAPIPTSRAAKRRDAREKKKDAERLQGLSRKDTKNSSSSATLPTLDFEAEQDPAMDAKPATPRSGKTKRKFRWIKNDGKLSSDPFAWAAHANPLWRLVLPGIFACADARKVAFE